MPSRYIWHILGKNEELLHRLWRTDSSQFLLGFLVGRILVMTDTELALLAERLWKELQENNLGAYSGINRPFWILHYFKIVRAIQKETVR
jgi:hypothetical protein